MLRMMLVCGLGAAALAGCKPEAGAGTGGPRSAVRSEAYCHRSDMSAALRQTVLVIDERAVKAAKPAEMRTVNAKLFELVMGLGDPVAGLESGAMAPRERLTIMIAPADGAAPRVVFTGCVPGLSPTEIAEGRARRSSVENAGSDFFGAGAEKKVEEAARGFRLAVQGALVRMGDAPQSGGLRPGGFEASSLLSSLKATRQLASDEGGMPRVFLFTDLATFPSGGERTEARTAGFAAARQAGVVLGGAEVYLVGANGPGPAAARDYAEAFFLGSQGDVRSWGGVAFNALTAAPVEVRTYTGEIAYPFDRFPARLILGRDAQGRLVNSWLITRTDGEWATPVTGALTCRDEVCRLLGDDGGLAQAWSTDPDPEPEFDAGLPLGGMRQIEAEVTPDSAEGFVSDPMISQFDGAPGVRTLNFTLNVQ